MNSIHQTTRAIIHQHGRDGPCHSVGTHPAALDLAPARARGNAPAAMEAPGTSEAAGDGVRGAPWIVGALVLVAFVLRGWNPAITAYNIDEAVSSSMALQITHLRRLPLTGLETSFHFHNPPLFFYLLAPCFLLTTSPATVALFFAAAGALGVLAVWRAGLALAGARAGLIAAALVAFAPSAVEHSRRLWGHDLIVPFSALALWGAASALRRGSWRALAGSFTAAVAAQSIHLSGVVLWLPGLVALATLEKRGRVRALAVAAGVLFLSYLPWVIEDARAGWQETRIILSQLGGGGLGRSIHPVPPLGAWSMLLADMWNNDLIGARRPWMLTPLADRLSAAVSVLALALLGAGLWRLAQAMHSGTRAERLAALLVAGPLLGTPLVFGVLIRAAVPPYQLPALVPMALAAAWGLEPLLRCAKGARPALAGVALYAVLAGALAIETRRAIAAGAGTSIPLGEYEESTALIRELVGHYPFLFAQDGRPTSVADVAWAFWFWHEGLDKQALPSAEKPPVLCLVVVDERTRIRPQVALFHRRFETARTQHLRLVVIPKKHIADYEALLRSFPAPVR